MISCRGPRAQHERRRTGDRGRLRFTRGGGHIAQNAIITAIDGVSIRSATALGPAIQSHKPCQQIRISRIDQSGTHAATVNLATGPAA